jgi:DNA polymerase elongation subunit (family B)
MYETKSYRIRSLQSRLYPSVGINYNLSFDTINCKYCKDNPKARLSATLDDKFLKDCKFVNKELYVRLNPNSKKMRIIRMRNDAENRIRRILEKGVIVKQASSFLYR